MSFAPVLLPGNMCDWRLWREVEADLSKLFAARCGHADLTADDSVTSMAERLLRSHEGNLLLIGLSMGAIVAVEAAVQCPARVKGLVLCGYNATADLPHRAALRPTQQVAARAGGLERIVVEELKPNYLAQRNSGEQGLLGLLRDMAVDLGPDVFVRQSEALRLRADRVEQLRLLPCPVLYAAGEEDALCPPNWHERWSSLTPGSQLSVIPGAGHMVPLEQPALFVNALRRWSEDKQVT
jgi:pimeloyl-ACP methyl ester carboxylesterase